MSFQQDDDPGHPSHRDHDLSEAAGWTEDDYSRAPKPWFLRRWFVLLVVALVVAGLLIPILPR